MLAWQYAGDLCDVATLGGAARKPHGAELAVLSRYFLILVVYDDDVAGQRASLFLRKFPRVEAFEPPAHDLGEYLVHGGDVRAWIAGLVYYCMVRLLQELGQGLDPEAREDWTLIRDIVQEASNDLSPLVRS